MPMCCLKSLMLNNETTIMSKPPADLMGKNPRLAKRFHPDLTGRNTTAEMQIINGFKSQETARRR